jgi:type II secretory pathway pseudopilin PulG
MCKVEEKLFRAERHEKQAGYVLLGVLILLAVFLMALAVAAPRVATEIQRDRETELYHRGQQYTRAIRLYYKRFGKYPSSVDQLEHTNNVRFLRKRYKDPITGADEWRIIHFGEAKLRAENPYLIPPEFGNGAAATYALSGPGSPISAVSQGFSAAGNAAPSVGFSAIQANGAAATPQTAAQPASADPTSTATSTGSSGQTLGGLGIIGVASLSPKKSLREYKRQKHYNEWEFTYDASLETMGSAGLGPAQVTQPVLMPSATQPGPGAQTPAQPDPAAQNPVQQ